MNRTRAFVISITIFGIFYVLGDLLSNFAVALDPFGLIQIYPFVALRPYVLVAGGFFGLLTYFLLSRTRGE